MDESAKATAIEIASAISSRRRCLDLTALGSMAAAYALTLNQTRNWCWLSATASGERGLLWQERDS